VVVLVLVVAVTLARVLVLERQGRGMMAVQDITVIPPTMAAAVVAPQQVRMEAQVEELEEQGQTSLAK
jgi:ribosomal protein S13